MEHLDHRCLRWSIRTLQNRNLMVRMWHPDQLLSRAVQKVAMKNVRIQTQMRSAASLASAIQISALTLTYRLTRFAPLRGRM